MIFKIAQMTVAVKGPIPKLPTSVIILMFFSCVPMRPVFLFCFILLRI